MALGSAILVIQLLLLLHSLPFISASDPYSYPHHRNFHPSRTVVIASVSLVVIFFLGLFSIYIQRCSRRSARFQPRTPLARRQQRGLNREVIESFPTMLYAEVKGLRNTRGSGELECAVCLSEFGEEETLRLLPKCSHAFHPDCIDLWLATHTSCPVCRADLAEGVGDIKQTDPVPALLDVNNLPVETAEQPPECVIVEVEEAATPASPSAAESKSGRTKPSWSSRSAAVGRYACWTEEDRERFTLRLPDSVRTDLMMRLNALTRSASVAAYPVVVVDVVNPGCSRSASEMLASGDGSSGWNAGERRVLAREWEPAAKSDRWAALVKTLPLKDFDDKGDTDSNRGT